MTYVTEIQKRYHMKFSDHPMRDRIVFKDGEIPDMIVLRPFTNMTQPEKVVVKAYTPDAFKDKDGKPLTGAARRRVADSFFETRHVPRVFVIKIQPLSGERDIPIYLTNNRGFPELEYLAHRWEFVWNESLTVPEGATEMPFEISLLYPFTGDIDIILTVENHIPDDVVQCTGKSCPSGNCGNPKAKPKPKPAPVTKEATKNAKPERKK